MIQNKRQFNGYNACSYCHHPGTMVKKTIRYTNLNFIPEKRTHSIALQDMMTAYETKSIVNGFKSISPLVMIPNFDIIKGIVIDYMHNSLLGVASQLLNLIFDSENHKTDFYIGTQIKRVDKKYLFFKPFSDISRMPRSLQQRKMFKANELRNWLVYYSIPSLQNILPRKYLEHFGLFSKSLYLLLQCSISREDIILAQKYITEFVLNYEKFYGADHMTYNVHLLLHLPDCVLENGPLWAYSNFHFESNNGALKKLVCGTSDVVHQTVKIC